MIFHFVKALLPHRTRIRQFPWIYLHIHPNSNRKDSRANATLTMIFWLGSGEMKVLGQPQITTLGLFSKAHHGKKIAVFSTHRCQYRHNRRCSKDKNFVPARSQANRYLPHRYGQSLSKRNRQSDRDGQLPPSNWQKILRDMILCLS